MQFSIRAMLLGIAIVALALGLYMRAVRRQQSIVRAIEEAGGYVVYDEGPGPDPFDSSVNPFASDLEPSRKPWLERWISSNLGKDFIYDVVSVELMRTSDADATLSRIANLTTIRSLYLHGSDVTGAGLACLMDLSDLSDLDLSDTEITDAELEPLRGLGHLARLDLRRTPVTSAAVAALQQALPDCTIARQTPVVEAMEEAASLEFANTPLVDVTECLEDYTGAWIVFEDDAVEFELCPVSVDDGEVSLEGALGLVLGPLGLTYRVDQRIDAVIIIRK